MTQDDYTTRIVTEGEQLLAAGKLRRAANKLQTAVENMPADHADAPELFARIREAANGVARGNDRYTLQVQVILDVIARRETYPARARGEASAATQDIEASAVLGRGEPWFYYAAESVATVAIAASVLSVIGGIVVGVEVSKYTTVGFGPETHHHAGVVGYWIAIGVFSAALWLALAVGIHLLADIGRSLRTSRSQS